MKRSEWENLIKDGNGRHVGSSTILGCPIYAIHDDKGYHITKDTIPAYVCEITEEDMSLVNKNNVAKVIYPMYICIPSKLLFGSESIPKVDIQILGMIAIDCHTRRTTYPLSDTMRLLEMWTAPHRSDESLELMLHKYLMCIHD